MRPIITLPGVALATPPALPSVRTPEGIAMGGIPDWELFVNPEHLVEGAPRNRAKPNSVLTPVTGVPASLTTFGNGETAFDHTGGASSARMNYPGVPFPAEAWTAFAVIEATNTSGDKTLFRSVPDNEATPGMSVRMGLNIQATDVTIYRGAAASGNLFLRYQGEPGELLNRVALIMFCGSARGASIYLDGAEVAVTNSPAVITTGTEAAAWRTQFGVGYRLGHYGVLARDLGLPQNRAYRERIEAFYKDKYGIA